MVDEKTELRDLARKRIEERRGLVPHVLIYVLVNLGLVFIWAFVANQGFFWPGFVIGFWGIGLVMHFWAVFFNHPITPSDIDREVERINLQSRGSHHA